MTAIQARVVIPEARARSGRLDEQILIAPTPRISNPLAAPLLAGPVEVFVDGALLPARLPVSEIDDVEITLTTAGGFRREGDDGLLLREVDLAPGATQTLEIGHALRASAKVALPV